MRRIPVLLVSVLAAGILAGGAVGVIVGASTVPSVKACVTKTTNVMRYTTSTCKTGEKLLTWNITGVAGPKGATGGTGPQGAAGAQGPAGPAGGSGGGPTGTTIYHGDNTGGISGTDLAVSTLRVPAGSYLLSWAVSGRSGAGVLTTCSLKAGDTLLSYAVFAAPTTITLICSTDIGKTVNFQHAEVFAQVATILPGI